MGMRSKEKGDKFEIVIEKLYNLISENERIEANVSRDVHLIGDDGTDNQFDIVYEYEHFGINYRVAIECKNWKNPINVINLRDFSYKLDRVGNINGIFISAESSFQDGGKKVAAWQGINLFKYDDFNRFISGQNEDYLLPDYTTIGDPFWMIMNRDGKNTLEKNSYLNCVYIFESRFFANDFYEKCLEKDDKFKVVGVSQKHLRELRFLVQKNRVKVKMFNAFAREYDEVNFHFWNLNEDDLEAYLR